MCLPQNLGSIRQLNWDSAAGLDLSVGSNLSDVGCPLSTCDASNEEVGSMKQARGALHPPSGNMDLTGLETLILDIESKVGQFKAHKQLCKEHLLRPVLDPILGAIGYTSPGLGRKVAADPLDVSIRKVSHITNETAFEILGFTQKGRRLDLGQRRTSFSRGR